MARRRSCLSTIGTLLILGLVLVSLSQYFRGVEYFKLLQEQQEDHISVLRGHNVTHLQRLESRGPASKSPHPAKSFALSYSGKEELPLFQSPFKKDASAQEKILDSSSVVEAENALHENPQGNYNTLNRTIHFLDRHQLNDLDGYSASWLQTRSSFLAMDLDRIHSCEDASFVAYWPRLRMTYDWLDCFVEHLSKWWKLLHVYQQDVAWKVLNQKLTSYTSQASQYVSPTMALRQTIAVIAYQPQTNAEYADRAAALTVLTLGATLESLRRAGMGRVVVVGADSDHESLVQETFQELCRHLHPTEHRNTVTRLGHMEVSFVSAPKGSLKTSWVDLNVPRGALVGLRQAFETKGSNDNNERDLAKQWLGEHAPEHWKYVYLTEPDSLLQLRSPEQLLRQADQGHVVVPHRLQPIPHDSDVHGMEERFYVPAVDGFENVADIDIESDACCDEHQGPDVKPGLPPNFPDCGSFWYMCGFLPFENSTHDRLRPYSLIRFQQGSGIVSLASLNHGRRCFLQENGTCGSPPIE